jgi:hypothetical protein
MEVNGLASRPYLFIPGEEPRYPLFWRLGGPQIWSGRRKSVTSSGNRPSNSRLSSPQHPHYAGSVVAFVGSSFDIPVLSIVKMLRN